MGMKKNVMCREIKRLRRFILQSLFIRKGYNKTLPKIRGNIKIGNWKLVFALLCSRRTGKLTEIEELLIRKAI